jgi:serine O-acetyltransferase
MKSSITHDDLCDYVSRQINNIFPDRAEITSKDIKPYIKETMERVQFCFKHIRKKYFFKDGQSTFDHLYSDHYSMLLYFLMNTVHVRSKETLLPTKLFLLNKALHGLDAYFNIELPDIFIFRHPMGTVLGNAKYKNYFAVYQNCVVGANSDGIYPELGEGVLLFEKSTVLGNCKLGNNVVFGSNASTIDTIIQDNTLVVGNYPNMRLLENKKSVIDRIFVN